jgi:fatty-acyl-CoA synthase
MLQGTRIIETVESAYANPLLLKQLLHTPIIYSPDQEIVYRDTKRFTYREFYSRMRRLASGMQALGIKPGDIVAFLDWDSYRYLEAYFSIPGIGAVLHCVNVRLSPDQILFTMNHAEDTVVFVHEDFIPLIEPIIDRLPSVRTWVLMKETDRDIDCSIPFECEYEDVLGKGTDDFAFPDFD